jgi:hypothetical protein
MQMESLILYPDHLHAVMQTPNGAITIVVTPAAAFMELPNGQTQPWPDNRRAESVDQIKRDPIFIAGHASDSNVYFHAAGTEKVGAVDARIVDVNADGAAIRWFIDPQTGHILKENYRTIGQHGPVQGETDMDDWRTINGITLPMVRHNKQDGQDSSTAEYTAVEFNP